MKINNKIIRLRRFAKSIFHCERSAAILLALALVLSLGILTIPVMANITNPGSPTFDLVTSSHLSSAMDATYTFTITNIVDSSTNEQLKQIIATIPGGYTINSNYITATAGTKVGTMTMSGGGGDPHSADFVTTAVERVFTCTYSGTLCGTLTLSGDGQTFTLVIEQAVYGLAREQGVLETIQGFLINPTTAGIYSWPATALGYETSSSEQDCSPRDGYSQDVQIGLVHNQTTGTYYSTIQAAIDAASSGGTVNVAAGTYEEDVTLDKNVSIYGGSPKPTLKGTGATTKKGALSFKGPLEGITIKDIIIEHDGSLIDVPLMDAAYLDPVFNGVEFIGMEFIQRGTWRSPNVGGKNPINFGWGYSSLVEGAGVLFKDCVMTNASGQDGTFMTWQATGGGPSTFDNVTIDGNGNETGINIYDGINVSVTDCHTMYNAYFYLSGLTNLTVENNIFSGYGTFVNGTNGATIRDNVFENTRGLEFTAAWGPTQNYDVLVEGNTFQNIDSDAIKIHRYTITTPDSDFLDVHYNNFIDTGGFAVNNTFDTFTVDATNNWWGDASGPFNSTTNPGGTGDKVSDNVDFIPFLASSGGVVVNNVSITKSGPTSANSGVDITYTITYKNIGTDYANNIIITEAYPLEVSYVSATPAPDSGTNNKWTIPTTLAPNAEGTITVTVHIK